MIKKLLKKLKVVNDTDLNNAERFIAHKKNLENKEMLKSCYVDFYKKILKLENKYSKEKGKVRIELGSGVGFFKKFDESIITSDVVYNRFTDKIIDADNLPFEKNSIDSIFGIFCFHHFQDQTNFLKNLEEKLKPGGLCILIEPYYGPLASMIYKRIHESEYFDINEDFNFRPKNKTAMEKANQALSYIYFIKNKDIFERKFSQLSIKEEFVFNNYLRFLFSGGLNFKKILPDFLTIILKILEKILSPFRSFLGIHHLIVIKKN